MTCMHYKNLFLSAYIHKYCLKFPSQNSDPLIIAFMPLSPQIFKFEKQYFKKRAPTPSTIFQLNSWEWMKSNI